MAQNLQALRLTALAIAAAATLIIGSARIPGTPAASAANFELSSFAPGLSQPVAITHAGDGSGRVFIVEQSGAIKVHDGSGVLAADFLDVSAKISTGDERGLLSVAFHPDYETNGYFFIYYTRTDGDITIERYSVSAGDPDVADPLSDELILVIDHPVSNHNGGQLQFGPDGLLYLGTGDGGGGGDPNNNAQNINVLLGKMLRLDVNGALPYTIPPANPLVGQPGRDEIWAVGMRNPWRFSFDRLTGDMFIADVGQGSVEEIDFQPAASTSLVNYGWRVMEGSACFNPNPGCNPAGLTLPIIEYGHTGGNCSVTGGYRYRGASPSLAGQYFYADYCSGNIWTATVSGSTWTPAPPLDTSHFISSFGEDEAGNLYIADQVGGGVYRIDALDDTDTDDDGVADTIDNCDDTPNPGQANADANFIDLSPPELYDDVTLANSDTAGDACDDDDDNDGLLDADEVVHPVPGCPSATTATNPAVADTDGDRTLDGAECILGFNPASAASRPPVGPIEPDADNDLLPDALETTLGSDPNDVDTDNDRMIDGVEFRYYNTSPLVTNTDGDICSDGEEIASINGDLRVNVVDLQQIAQSQGLPTDPLYLANMDMNKNGQINVADIQIAATQQGNC